MKTVLIILSVIVLLVIGFIIFTTISQKNIEDYPYEVIKKFEEFEIRKYEASLFTSVQVSSNEYSTASSKGFSILGGYIFGGNEKNEKIAMTSPVAMSLEDSMTMMFMVPKNYKKEDLPKPSDSNISFVDVPTKTVAALEFGGWANDEKIEQNKQKLINLLNEKGIAYTNQFSFYGYNPPYEVVNRKNEVIVELDSDFILP